MNKSILARELFYFLSSALVLAVLLEILWPRIILAYFNMNFLFIAALLSAIYQLLVRGNSSARH